MVGVARLVRVLMVRGGGKVWVFWCWSGCRMRVGWGIGFLGWLLGRLLIRMVRRMG